MTIRLIHFCLLCLALQNLGLAAEPCTMQNGKSTEMTTMSDHSHHQMTNEVKLTEMTDMAAHDCCDANCECLLNASQSAISVPLSPAIQQPQFKSLWFGVPNLSLDHITDRIDRPPIFA